MNAPLLSTAHDFDAVEVGLRVGPWEHGREPFHCVASGNQATAYLMCEEFSAAGFRVLWIAPAQDQNPQTLPILARRSESAAGPEIGDGGLR